MNCGKLVLLCSVPLATFLGGCVPSYLVDASTVRGQVVDRTTHQPIAGAKVVLTSARASVQTQSDPSGSFRLPALQHWTVVPLISEGFVSNGHLRIDAAGYKPYTGQETDLDSGYGNGDGAVQRVHIMLAPTSSKSNSIGSSPLDHHLWPPSPLPRSLTLRSSEPALRSGR